MKSIIKYVWFVGWLVTTLCYARTVHLKDQNGVLHNFEAGTEVSQVWNPIVGGTPAYIQFDNVSWDFNKWFDPTTTGVTENSDSSLTFHIYRSTNPYYCSDTNTITGVYNTLRGWRSLFYARWDLDPTNDIKKNDFLHCVNVMRGLTRQHVFKIGFVNSVDIFGLGKYHWSVTGNFNDIKGIVHSGCWIDSDTSNWHQARNEVDFEFGGYDTTSNFGVPKVGCAIQPWTGPGAHDPIHPYYRNPMGLHGLYGWPERFLNDTVPAGNLTSIHWFTYKPEEIAFHNEWPSLVTSWTFPAAGYQDTARCGYFKNDMYDSGADSFDTPIVVPHLRPSFAHMGFATVHGDTDETSCMNIDLSGNPDAAEFTVNSFAWTGIPDLSFYEKCDSIRVNATTNRYERVDTTWALSGWSKPLIVSDNTMYPPQATDVRVDHPAYINFTLHNVGTAATSKTDTIRLRIYVNRDRIDTFTIQHPLPVDSIYFGKTPYTFTQLGWNYFRIEIDPDNRIEELRKSNNVFSDSIRVIPAR